LCDDSVADPFHLDKESAMMQPNGPGITVQ